MKNEGTIRKIPWPHALEEQLRGSAELQRDHHGEGESKWQSRTKKPFGDDAQGRPNILIIFGDDIGIAEHQKK
jgi:hypothetical protein